VKTEKTVAAEITDVIMPTTRIIITTAVIPVRETKRIRKTIKLP